jgi:hypothetical protein
MKGAVQSIVIFPLPLDLCIKKNANAELLDTSTRTQKKGRETAKGA